MITQSIEASATGARGARVSPSAKRGTNGKRLLRARLSYEQILAWADAHRARTGSWPTKFSGKIRGAKREHWNAVSSALYLGFRGLPGGCTLAQFLLEKRGVRNKNMRTRVSIGAVLKWADEHHARHGVWPKRCSGEIPDSGGGTWARVDMELRRGVRNLRDGTTLFQFLVKRRGINMGGRPPRLSVEQVFFWADQYFAAHGSWPNMRSGIIPNSRGHTWRRLEMNLRRGTRGLPGGTTLGRLLEGRVVQGTEGKRPSHGRRIASAVEGGAPAMAAHGSWP